MLADKHFKEHGVISPAVDDYKPDDRPAVRTIGIVILSLLGVRLLANTIIHSRAHYQPASTTMDEVHGAA
ncbi:MAG: hypothetical protein ABI432_18460 [Flavobacteriales bacterium]